MQKRKILQYKLKRWASYKARMIMCVITTTEFQMSNMEYMQNRTTYFSVLLIQHDLFEEHTIYFYA